jgi:hypothetical protein
MRNNAPKTTSVIKNLVLFTVFILIGCQEKMSATMAPIQDRVSAEYMVFATVIPELYGSESIYVIEQNSRLNFAEYYIDHSEQLVKELPTIKSDTMKDFADINIESYSLENIFSRDTTFILVNREDYLRPMMCVETPCVDVEKLQQQYPNAKGVIMLSKVGFNAKTTQALVFAEIDDGDHQGEYYLVLLKWQNEQWIIEDTIKGEWVS